MNKDDIFRRLCMVLSAASHRDPASIQLGHTLKIYVPPVAILSFALKIDQAFPKLDLTDLTNSLYDPIAKVGDLVNYIDGVYNNGS